MPETCSRQDSQQLFPRALPSLLPSTKTGEIRIGTQVQPRIVAPCWFFSIHAFLSIFFQFALAGAPCAAGLRFCFLHPNLKFFSTLYSLSFCSGHFFSYFDWYCHLEPMTRYDFRVVRVQLVFTCFGFCYSRCVLQPIVVRKSKRPIGRRVVRWRQVKAAAFKALYAIS